MQGKNRTLIPISIQAHAHLKAVVAAMIESGLPTSGTMVASEVILSIPIPQPQPVEKKQRPRRKVATPMSQTVPVVGA